MKDILLSRDPSGFIFKHNGRIHRAINYSYQQNYEYLIQSGLYDRLCSEGLLIPHTELNKEYFTLVGDPFGNCYKIIAPVEIEFISYPYEWSFEQLKDAAITTLLIQRYALEHNMSLKDASAYNIQFLNCKPVFIDTLSFEIFKDGYPWIAYKQFCQHFLAPLLLMSYKDERLHKLLSYFPDGIPLDLANSLLPLKSKLNPRILLHINLHSKAQKKFKNKELSIQKHKFSKASFFGLIDNLLSTINKIKLKRGNSNWSRRDGYPLKYYEENILNSAYINHKKQLVNTLLEKEKPRMLWDLGSNIGMFSKIAAEKNIEVICFDSDPMIINKIYVDCKAHGEVNILPLILDLVNPSCAAGWMLSERISFLKRASADMVMALALIHHLAIANNIPLGSLAEFFSKIAKKLIIEFVPKSDANAQLLLRNREDIFLQYNQSNFEKEFEKFFRTISREKIDESERVLFLMESNQLPKASPTYS